MELAEHIFLIIIEITKVISQVRTRVDEVVDLIALITILLLKIQVFQLEAAPFCSGRAAGTILILFALGECSSSIA